jgi:uncharacterized protein
VALPELIAQALGPPGPLLLFLLCVAFATAAQTLTGFAFSLILLGLSASLGLASVADAANAASVLTLVNAATYFAGRHDELPWTTMRPALLASLPGVVAGVLLLAWLSGHSIGVLRLLLGLTIIGCAGLLLLKRARATRLAPPSSFIVAGLSAGLLSGLFSTSGPPMIFHLYRQPLPPHTVRDALLMLFAVNASLRLVMVLATGGFTLRAALLALLALPLVAIVTRAVQRHPPPIGVAALRIGVAVLLAGAGLSLVATGWTAVR